MKTYLLGAVCALALAYPAQAVVNPIHQWTFDNGTATDSIGGLNGTLYGNAVISGGQLIVNGTTNNGVQTYMSTAADSISLTAMTLVSWVSLATTSQSGGSALSAVTDGQQFDAIDYAEGTAGQWMNGSDYASRSRYPNGGSTVQDTAEHMMAITYGANGQITLYKDGAFYADGGTFGANTLVNPHYLLGLRHDTGGNAMLNGSIDMAAVYSSALSSSDIATLYAQGPSAAVPEPASWAMMIGGFGMIGGALRRRKTSVRFA